MSMADSLLKKDTVFLLEDDKEYSAEEILQNIGKRLSKRGYVKESFGNALIEREKKYPTGLKTYPYAVAIPHTDLGHVNIPCISFVRLKKGVDFHEMVNTSSVVNVQFLFCIALDGEDKQTDILQYIMKIINDEMLMGKLKNASNEKEIYQLLIENE